MAITYDPISTTTLPSAVNTVTISSIPQTYTDLVLVISNLRDSAGGSSVVAYRYNGDTASNYSTTYMGTSGAGGLFSGYRTADTGIWFGGMYSNRGMFKLDVMNYSNTTTFKTSLSRQSFVGTAYEPVGMYSGTWRSTSAVTSITIYSIDISPLLDANTVISLYGIKSS
jgi:hypothetical protein